MRGGIGRFLDSRSGRILQRVEVVSGTLAKERRETHVILMAVLLGATIDTYSMWNCNSVVAIRYDGFDGVSHTWTARCDDDVDYRLWLRPGRPATIDRCENLDSWMKRSGFDGRCWPEQPADAGAIIEVASTEGVTVTYDGRSPRAGGDGQD